MVETQAVETTTRRNNLRQGGDCFGRSFDFAQDERPRNDIIKEDGITTVLNLLLITHPSLLLLFLNLNLRFHFPILSHPAIDGPSADEDQVERNTDGNPLRQYL